MLVNIGPVNKKKKVPTEPLKNSSRDIKAEKASEKEDVGSLLKQVLISEDREVAMTTRCLFFFWFLVMPLA
jgi:hypothetical protein